MSRKYKFNDQDQLYFVTFAVVNWIDLFIRNEYRDIMLESWKHCLMCVVCAERCRCWWLRNNKEGIAHTAVGTAAGVAAAFMKLLKEEFLSWLQYWV